MKLETHIHTGEVSRCAECDAAAMVARCIRLGYDGMVVTDHFAADTIPKRLQKGKITWRKRVEFFLSGYNAARVAAPMGFTVILGMELRFSHENSNDYLVYGIDEEFLYKHENIDQLGIKAFGEFARAHDLLVVHAHPFRFGMTVTRPQYLDAIEVHNGHANHASHDDIAEAWCNMHGKIALSGSDFHGGDTGDGKNPGGIILPKPVKDSKGLVRAIRAGEYTLLK